MKYYILDPEVAGGFGPNAVIDPTVRPPNVSHFHYQFDGWLGDPLLETIGCFIVTTHLKHKIEAIAPTGVSFGYVEISKSSEFEDLFPDQELPEFAWLQVTGRVGQDDFGLSLRNRLIVSERILNLLKNEGLSHCDIAEYDPCVDPEEGEEA